MNMCYLPHKTPLVLTPTREEREEMETDATVETEKVRDVADVFVL